MGMNGYIAGSSHLSASAEKRLSALAEARKIELINYFKFIRQDLVITASNPNTIAALKNFKQQWDILKDNRTQILKNAYIKNNPHPRGEKHKLLKAPASRGYNSIHAKFHPWFKTLQTNRGYYDVFLFDTRGNLIYTVSKEEDFATNFRSRNGPWSETSLGIVYRKALMAQKDQQIFSDFKFYAPSNNAPASFIATPVFDKEKQIGVLAFQMPVDEINRIMNVSSGLGKTGEIVIFGADYLMRSDSRFTRENDILKTRKKMDIIDKAISNTPTYPQSNVLEDEKIARYAIPFNFLGTKWAIVATQEWNELNTPLISMRNNMIMTGFILLLLAATIGYLIAAGITGSVIKFATLMKTFVDNNKEIDIADPQRTDELGEMTTSLATLINAAKEHIRLKDESELIRDNAPDGIMSIDQDGTIISINKAITKIFLYEAEELVGQNINILVPRHYHIAHSNDVSYYISSRNTKRMAAGKDLVGIRKDGAEVPVTVGLSSTVMEGEGTRIIATVQDITERKLAEEKFNELSERMALILDNAGEGIFGLDINGHTTFCNQAASDMLGYTIEEMVNKSQHELIHHHYPDGKGYPREESNIYKTLKDAKAHSGDNEVFWRKNGLPLPVHYSSKPIIDDHNNVTGAVVVFHDITERKKTEEQLHKKSHELQFKTIEAETEKENAIQANKTKGDFLANMSHEIRTPMNGIVGMSELLLKNEKNELQRERLEIIKNCGDALLELINDILDLSKIEAEKLTLENISFNLHDIIADVLNILNSKADKKGLELAFRYAPGTPVTIDSDPVRIRQIILNLIGNAIKFTKKGHVYINVEASEKTKKRTSILFQISDTGIGIPKNRQSAVFDDFSQASASTTREFGGSGLGLAITKKLVQLMRGEIGLLSQEGQGSTFWFELTFPAEIEPVAEITSLRPDERNEGRILIIDEQEISPEILKEYVKDSGLNVTICHDCKVAVAELQSAAEQNKAYSATLICPPFIDFTTKQIAEEIKSNNVICGTHLIMISPFGLEVNTEELKTWGFDAFLISPVHSETLNGIIEKVLDLGSNRASDGLITKTTINREIHNQEEETIENFDAHILVAEDNMTNQIVIEQMLEDLGCRISLANNGKEALSMASGMKYDLILMDCRMPEMDGYEAATEIKSNHVLYHNIPVIALTANALAEDREKCLEAGMDDYLSKPVSDENLQAMLSKFLKAEKFKKSA